MTDPSRACRDESRLYGATELARELAITPRALRFYESKGLLEPQRVGARRIYTYRDRARLILILRAKRLGFSLAEVAEYLHLYDADRTKTSQLKGLAAAVERRMDSLREQHAALLETLSELESILAETRCALRERGIDPDRIVRTPAASRAGAGRAVQAATGPNTGDPS